MLSHFYATGYCHSPNLCGQFSGSTISWLLAGACVDIHASQGFFQRFRWAQPSGLGCEASLPS